MPLVTAGSTDLDRLRRNGSPYALRVNGVWVDVDGVEPSVPVTTERPRSEMTTVDGVRFTQQAPLVAREWALDLRHATPTMVTILALAAEAPGEVLLFDAAAARANMLRTRQCYGAPGAGGAVVDCGGIPLRAKTAGSITAPVRGPTAVTFTAWSSAAPGTTLATLTYPGGTVTLAAAPGAGDRPSSVTFAPTADGTLTIAHGGAVAGLMLTEGKPATRWAAGHRTPCPVSVEDPSQTLTRLSANGQGRSDYGVTLREVG